MTGDRRARPASMVGWGGIIAALVFFFNPDVGMFDILPDFIGYILLCAAIKKLADIDDRVGEARELFVRMIYISLVKFVMFFVQLGFIPTSDQSVSTLMFAFIFSLLEVITVIPAVMKLTDGILYLSSRHSGTAAYAPAGRKNKRSSDGYRRTLTERARNTSVAFVIIKALCRTLPEFSALTEQSYNESAVGQLYMYVGLFRIFGFVLALAAAIVWIIPAARYVGLMKRDAAFLCNLGEKYDADILSQTDRLARRAVRVAFGYFGAAAVFSLDFYLDNINILPDVLTSLAIIAGLLIIRKHIGGWREGILASGIYGAVSLASAVAEYNFNANYYSEAIMKDEATYNAFLITCGLSAAAAAAFIAAVAVLLFIVIKDIIRRHTGFSMTTTDTYDPAEKIRLLHLALSRRLILPAVFAALAAASSVTAKFLINTVDFMWMIEFLLSALFAFWMIKIMVEINEQISYKYMLS